MPAIPSFLIEPIWEQFRVLIPVPVDAHPLGCHRRRIPDRIIFNKLVQVLVLGCAYVKIADSSCSATTLRDRRDEWIDAGIFARAWNRSVIHNHPVDEDNFPVDCQTGISVSH